MNIWHKLKCLFGFHNYEYIGTYFDSDCTPIVHTALKSYHIYIIDAYKCNHCDKVETKTKKRFLYYSSNRNYYRMLVYLRKKMLSKEEFFTDVVEK